MRYSRIPRLAGLILITLLVFPSAAAFAQLTENCTVSILNRTARVRADGTWKIPNVPATFGRVRARATCTENGVTRSGQSSYVLMTPSRTAAFDSDISLTTPEPIPASLTLTAPVATLSSVGATTQLTVTARFPDGSTRDVTAGTSGTNYTISNRAVATVSADGLVTAVAGGTVILSALHEGALGLLRLQVASTTGDSDGDGIPDDVEIANGLNPNDPTDAAQDADSDGLTNKQELVDYNTNPHVADTDGDGIRDGLEIQTGSNPLDPGSRNLAQALTAIVVTPTSSLLIRNTLIGSATRQLTVSGQLRDGNTIDLTATATGTTYTSSDPAICDLETVSGRVFAGESAGTCTITATNSGFTATASVTVEIFAPTALSSIAIPGYANNVDVNGDYAYVAAGAAGLQVVDVSTPSAPVIVGALDTPGNANDVRIVGTLAYLADGVAGLQIIDVNDPTTPVLVGTLDTPGEAQDVVVVNERAYVADGEAGLQIVEVSNLAEPVLRGTVDTPGFARGVAVNGTLAVVADDRVATLAPGIVTIALEPATNLLLLQRVEARTYVPEGGGAADIEIRGGLAYLAADLGGGTQVMDISVPANPRVIGSLGSAGVGIAPLDLALFSRFVLGVDAFPFNRIGILDIGEPRTPLFVATLDFAAVVPAGDRYSGTGIAITPQYVYMTGAMFGGVQNGEIGTTRLLIGQYLKFPDDSAGIAPTVQITTPLAGTTVAEGTTVAITVEAQDDVAVASIDILVNGQVVAAGTDIYEFRVPVGVTSLTIGARAIDAGTNVGVAPEVVVTVVPDTTPPEVRITTPTTGSTVPEQATLPVAVLAVDNVAVASVDLLVNGQVVQTLTSEPYEFTITVPTGVNSLTLSARATDHKGQVATAPSVTLAVVADTTAPVVTITSPTTGDTVRGLTVVQVTAEASDNVGVTAVDFLVNGEVVGTVTSVPYQFGVTIPNTASSVRLGVQVRDAAGNVGTATEVVLTVMQDQPPTVTLTAPSAGTTVMAGSTVTLQAEATDDDAGAAVHFLIDGQLVFVAHRTPYQFHLRVPTEVSTLRLGVSAVDSGGQTTTGTEVQVTVIPDPKTTATGRVIDGSGVPVTGVRVTCLGESGTAAADGRFSIPGVATARGTFACSASLTTLDSTLLGGTSAAVTPVESGATSFGDVIMHEGARYPGLRISVEQPRPIPFGGFGSGAGPVGLVTGDLNGDGHSDLVTANRNVRNLSVLLGAGEGTFQPQQTLGLDSSPEALTVADLNNDGRLDLVVAPAGTTQTQIGILLGNGNGTFQPQQRVTVGTSPSAVTTADVNGDGKLDVLVVNNGSDDVSILLGTGTGTFQPQQRVAVAASPREIAVSELNGDGHVDVVIAHVHNTGLTRQVSILLGTGTGTFQVQPELTIDSDIRALALGDLNGDGTADLVVTETQSSPPALFGGVRIFLGTGTGTFQASALVLTNNFADRVVMADLTGDTHLDLVVTGEVDEGTVLVGDGTGNFTASSRFVVGARPSAIAVADVTGDGVVDVAVTNEDSNDISVLVGQGDGRLDSGRMYATSGPSSVLEHAEVNGDGIEDLLTVGSNGVAVLLGVGDGSFDEANEFSVEASPEAVTVADVNGDGSKDLVMASGFSTDEVRIFFGTRYGTFPTFGPRLTVGETPVAIAARDVNRDGTLDLVTLNRDSFDISVLVGTGSGTFQTEQRFPIGMFIPTNMTLADFNGDGALDVVTANGREDFVSLLLGTGTGTFATAQALPLAPGDTPSAVAAADVNRDNNMDLLLVVAHQGSTDVVVWLGTGSGTFEPERRTALGSTADAFTVTDIDGDGELDCVLTNTLVGRGRVTVALGTGDGMFGQIRSFGVGGSPIGGFGGVDGSRGGFVVADVNGDGQSDLLAPGSPSFNQGRLLVLLHR